MRLSKSLRTTAQLCTLAANQCPSFERYVATFYHLSPFEVRSAAFGRWEGQTKASSVLSPVKIWLLFRCGGEWDRSPSPPILQNQSSLWKGSAWWQWPAEKKESYCEAAVLNLKQEHFAVHGSSLQSQAVPAQDGNSKQQSELSHRNLLM